MKKGKVYMSMETVNGTYGSEEQKIEEMTRYLNGLKMYTEKGIPIYMVENFPVRESGKSCLKCVRTECSTWGIMCRQKEVD